jgi:hypothetical protein
MPRRPLKIAVSIVGTEHPRFVIVNNRRQFWDGVAWTTVCCNAQLFAHAWLAQREVKELRQKYCR